MSRFLQLHLLTFYPPSNLNRDDTGRPKTARVGGQDRLRISSQALKRAWRTSETFLDRVGAHRGERTQRLGEAVLMPHLRAKGVEEKKALEWVRLVLPFFGKPKSEEKNLAQTEQLVFVSPEEKARAIALLDRMAAGEKPEIKAEDLLLPSDTATDIAMFGRMLADRPEFNRDAAVQVAHAFTTHRAIVEDDYYTAVDDLKGPEEDAGAGFIGELGFGSGVFYLYACVDRALLLRNLGGNAALAAMAQRALTEAAAKEAPRGKQNSFAARARAFYVLAEKGDDQPRTLAGAFARPVASGDVVTESIGVLRDFRFRMDAAYGMAPLASAEMDVVTGQGSLAALLDFVQAE